MATPSLHPPVNPAPARRGGVKLIIGLISHKEALFHKTKKILEEKFGPSDYISPLLQFNYTRYYDDEFGEGLKRQFLSFHRLTLAENIYKIKLFTNKLEKSLSLKGKRQINIDPGYLNLSKLVLLTTKDYFHRIYLSKGIYAEITLYFQANTFKPFKWTYPDYRTADYIEIFNRIRKIYAGQIK